MSIGKAALLLATRSIHIQPTRFDIEDATEMEPRAPVPKQPSPVLELAARPKFLPIHSGVENLGIHYGV